MKPLLVISSGSQDYREYALRSLAEEYPLVLLNDKPNRWQAPYLLDFAQVSLTDRTAVLQVLKKLRQRYEFAGVFTYDEPYVELAAALAEVLGLPHNSPQTARLCRDKHLMRQAWQQANVPSARSYLVPTIEEAMLRAEDIGYPVILKPRGMAASAGVIRVDDVADLPAGYRVASMELHPAYLGAARGVLLEEYLDGPEISVESAVMNGQVRIIAITRKQIGLAPYFEEIGHIVAPMQPLHEEAQIRATVIAAHQALGITYGLSHAELRLTATGPRMIELGARSGGDLIPYLVQLATGIDLHRIGARIATGQPFSVEPHYCRAAAVRFLYPPYDALIERLELQPATTCSWLERVVFEAKVGDRLYLPPRGFLSRLGCVVVSGATLEECQGRLTQATSLVDMTLTPLPLLAEMV